MLVGQFDVYVAGGRRGRMGVAFMAGEGKLADRRAIDES